MTDPIVVKIVKLLAQAHGKGVTPGEAAAAAAKVQASLLEHNLSMEHIEQAAAAAPYSEERPQLFSGSRWRVTWESMLVRAVTENLLCVSLQIGGTREIVFIGRAHNIAVAIHLYVYLQREIARLALAAVPRYRRRSARELWQRKFGIGAVAEIAARLEERRCSGPSEVAALVLRTDAALASEVARRYPKTRDGRAVKARWDSTAYVQGRLAGRRIPLRDAVAANERRELPAGADP